MQLITCGNLLQIDIVERELHIWIGLLNQRWMRNKIYSGTWVIIDLHVTKVWAYAVQNSLTYGHGTTVYLTFLSFCNIVTVNSLSWNDRNFPLRHLSS